MGKPFYRERFKHSSSLSSTFCAKCIAKQLMETFPLYSNNQIISEKKESKNITILWFSD